MTDFVLHQRAVYTADGLLVGKIVEWKTSTFGDRCRVAISIETSLDAAELFHPIDGMLRPRTLAGVTSHEGIPALFPGAQIAIAPQAASQLAPSAQRPALTPDGRVVEPLSIFGTGRFQPRDSLLQGTLDPTTPIVSGVTHERQRQAERLLEEKRMLEEHADAEAADEHS